MRRDEAVARLRSARVGHLATMTSGSRPHVVPFVFVVIESDAAVRVYWAVDDKPKRSPRIKRIRNIETNRAVELVVDGYDEDWSALWWVRAAGSGRIVREPAEHAAALVALEAKYPQYAAAPPPGPMVAIDVERITSWEATPNPEP
ncbi:MAG: TIGR03668 family PPOX class F420-dependent oxidoreductase [Actinomycetota bacterium]